jgi:hypothetical protein
VFIEFLLGQFLAWLPKLFFGLIFLVAALFYIRKRFERKVYIKLAKISVGFRFIYTLILMAAQYFVWAADAFSSALLKVPLDSSLPFVVVQKMPWLFGGRLGYFLFYSWGRFWLNFVLTVIVSLMLWLFLKFLRRYRDRFFEEGEIELGFLTAFISGWPAILVFLPTAFLFVILMSLSRMFLWQEKYTTLGYPFLLAALLTLLFGQKLLALTGLWILKV